MGSTIRKVPLKLGLIGVTVGVQGAVDNSGPTFHTVCDTGHDPARVKQSLGCPKCSNSDRGTFKKAQPTDDGKYVVVTQEELAGVSEVPPEVREAINLTAHPAADLTFAIPGEKIYYLAPTKGDHDNYALLVDLVERRDDVALCTMFAIKSKPAMYRLGTHDGALTLVELAMPDTIKPAPQHEGKVDEAMATMAAQFIDSILTEFDPAAYSDMRAEAITDFISKQKAVASGDEDAVTTAAPDDLMAAMAKAMGQKAPAKKKTAKKATKKAATKKAG